MWAAAAGPPISAEKVSFTDRMFPVRVTVINPLAEDPVGGTSPDPKRVAVKIPSAFVRGAVSKAPASSRMPTAIFLFIFSLPSLGSHPKKKG
jgi:hypothetical protein